MESIIENIQFRLDVPLILTAEDDYDFVMFFIIVESQFSIFVTGFIITTVINWNLILAKFHFRRSLLQNFNLQLNMNTSTRLFD